MEAWWTWLSPLVDHFLSALWPGFSNEEFVIRISKPGIKFHLPKMFSREVLHGAEVIWNYKRTASNNTAAEQAERFNDKALQKLL